ncbi:hypothetical protein HDV00_005130 [Rhizophlyctis rosea]|nr:hypothetical protein HDV00_005130 [Rhizophlyctis rosea]
MHTVTSKAVLTPLADAVTSLIVTVSDAETEGTPMPDLSALAQAVDAQITNLVDIAKQIAQQPNADDILRKEVPEACGDVTKSSHLLVSSCSDTLLSDRYSPKGRNDLLEAVKGILTGTTKLLNVVDDADVRRILACCKTVEGHLANIELYGAPPTTPSSSPAEAQKQYISTIGQGSQAIVTLAQLTTKRVNELVYAALQTRLQAAIAVLTKESPLLITACKAALVNPSSESARSLRNGVCQRLALTCKEIAIVVTFTTEEEAVALHNIRDVGKMQRLMNTEMSSKLMAAAQSGSSEQVTAVLKEEDAAMDIILTYARDALSVLTDPKQKTEINGLVEDIATARVEVNRNSLEAHLDARRQTLLLDAHELLVRRTSVLETGINRAIVGDVTTAFSSLSSTTNPATALGRLHAATSAPTPNKEQVAEAVKQFAGLSKQLTTLATMAIESIADESPALAHDIQMRRDRVEQLAAAVEAAAQLVAAGGGKDAVAMEYYKGVMSAYVEYVKDLEKVMIGQEGVFKAHELVSGTQNAIEQHMVALESATAAGDIEATRREAAHLAAAANNFVAVARRELENTGDTAYKSELQTRIFQVEMELPNILRSAMMVSHTTDSAAITAGSNLFASIRGLTDTLAALGDVMKINRDAPPDVLAVPSRPATPPPDEEEIEIIDAAEGTVKGVEPVILAQAGGLEVVGVAVGGGGDSPEGQDQLGASLGQPQGPEGRPRASVVSTRSRRASVLSNRSGNRSRRASVLSNAPPPPGMVIDHQLEQLAEKFEDAVIIDDAAPVMLTEAEAKADPIKAAGQELKVETANWSSDENPIITTATHLSTHLLSLSEYHTSLRHSATPANKKSFISTAQQITSESLTFTKTVRQLASVCTDKRLRKTLLLHLERIESLGQQLKIVAAVKAANPGDRDQDAQLVGCATNLMKATKACLRDCESASLRVEEGKGGNVRFRRQIYRFKMYGSGEGR